MTNGEDLHALVFDPVQNAVDTATLAVEKLANTLLTKAGLGRKGTAFRELAQTLDSITQTIGPF
jgi:hypothetical protein